MTYAGNRTIHDADSHVMEPPGTLEKYIEKKHLKDFERLCSYRQNEIGTYEAALKLQEDEEFRAGAEENLMTRKRYESYGGYIKEDRSKALDLFGYASQLTFTSTVLSNFDLEHRAEPVLAAATARGHNRMMTDFCSDDPRMLATGIIPMIDPQTSVDVAKECIDMDCKGLIIPSRCPADRSPSHKDYDAVWAIAQEAGVPILFHLGGGERMGRNYLENGRGKVLDAFGGDENFTSLEFIAVPLSVQQSMAALIFDGICDRFPNLKFGCMELGASWVPGWMKWMDFTVKSFKRGEERLQKLSAKPSEIAQRQLRVSPFYGENVGWIMDNGCEDMLMFASDYPHFEGGRDPIGGFERYMQSSSAATKKKFYRDNYLDLMGDCLDASLHDHPSVQAA